MRKLHFSILFLFFFSQNAYSATQFYSTYNEASIACASDKQGNELCYPGGRYLVSDYSASCIDGHYGVLYRGLIFNSNFYVGCSWGLACPTGELFNVITGLCEAPSAPQYYSTYEESLSACALDKQGNELCYPGGRYLVSDYSASCIDGHYNVTYRGLIFFTRFYVGCSNGSVCSTSEVLNINTGLCETTVLPKDFGQPCDGESTFGNPCNATNGNKYQKETDYTGNNTQLSFSRHYNSGLNEVDNGMGYGWVHQWAAKLDITSNKISIQQSDGRGEPFVLQNNLWQGDADTQLALIQDSTGYTLSNDNGTVERYDLDGYLLSKTDLTGKQTQYSYNTEHQLITLTSPFGHTLQFSYNADKRIESLITSKGEIYQYQYDTQGNLLKVIYPDNAFKQYHYENTDYPHALTGITDENADRYSTFAYNSDGKAILTQHAQTDHAVAQEKFALSYDSDTQTTVTDAIGTIEVLTFAENLNVKKLLSRINQTDSKGISRSYDDNNNLLSQTDAEGKITSYSYNTNNQRTHKTEGVGSNEEKITEYQYMSNELDLPTLTQITSVVTGNYKQTVTIYNSNNTVQSITLKGYQPDGTVISRNTSFQYNSLGQVTKIDGSQAGNQDITTLTYYDCNTGNQCGQLAQVSNALGQTTTYDQYDANGRLLKSTDANGLISQYQYDSRGRLLSLTQTPAQNQTQARITDYSYDPAGQLLTVIQPDGLQLDYQYDAAHDLRSISDNLDNKINYFYDAKGNRTRTENKDASGELLTAIEQVYNSRNRLQSINNAGNISQTLFDATGNLLTEIDPNQNPATKHSYDGLNRLQQTLDALGNATDYQYDTNNQLTQVKSPNNATTDYSYDDFGNLLQENSLDRGLIKYSHDTAGNIIGTTDARGITASYHYDLLNRVSEIDYPGNEEDIHYSYDNCLNGVGRLCQIEDQSGITQYAYDNYGNLTAQLKTELGTTYRTIYSYDAANRIISIVYPNSRKVEYNRDVLGRIIKISTEANSQSLTIANAISYRGDGLLTKLSYGNSKQESRTYDTAGRLSCIQTDTMQNQCYQYDANGNIIEQQKITQQHDYAYDVLDRLLQENTITNNINDNWLYSYDENGNRLTRNQNQAVNDYIYQQDSNQLITVNQQNIQLDAAGNTLSDKNGDRRFQYNQQGRLFKVYDKNQLKAIYTYNALGQRSRKEIIAEEQDDNEITLYHYQQNGQLLAETAIDSDTDTSTDTEEDTSESLGLDYIWLGNRPIAQLQSEQEDGQLTTADIIYLHSDHLNTPRLGTNETAETVWSWKSDAFGNSMEVIGDDELDDDTMQVNLRFAGQYFDAETNLHYNYFRYYDPTTGRYITSDPIGLQGGLNTYAYVGGNPLGYIDPLGLTSTTMDDFRRQRPRPFLDALLSIPFVQYVVEMCTKDKDDKKKCKLHSQNKIGLPPGKIRCNYICPLGSGNSGFVTRIINGNSCKAEYDADSVPGDQGF